DTVVDPNLGPAGGGPPGLLSAELRQGLCAAGYAQVQEVCIHRNVVSVRQPTVGLTFPEAQLYCGGSQATARVATYADYLRVFKTISDDQSFDPEGLWLGPDLVGDDQALVGNRPIRRDNDPNENNFEGIANKNERHDF